MKNKTKNNELKKSFFITAGTVFAIVGIAHLYRAFSEWTLVVDSFVIPVWLSFIAGIAILWLSIWAFKLSKK